MEHLLKVEGLKTHFRIEGKTIKAVDDVSYHIDKGEIVAFVGESGSGKSVTQYSGLQLIPTPPGNIVAGKIIFRGKNVLEYGSESEEMRKIRGGGIGVIFQEPMTSLNPVIKVGKQVAESVMLHLKVDKKQAMERTIELFKLVKIPDAEERIHYYPHQFSGGMRQRIMIAMALASNPELLIADEATTALDVTTQAQILETLKEVVKKTNTSLVIVSHNLGVVARYAERIYVMYAGGIVESGTTKEIFGKPKHPYTIGLMKAVPRLDDPKDRRLESIEGLPPNLAEKQDQCQFYDRCSFKTEQCKSKPIPKLAHIEGMHFSACYESENIKLQNLHELKNENQINVSITHKKNFQPEPILEVRNLKVHFPVTSGFLQRKIGEVKAVDDISFTIFRGETLGLVGESGCGKTTVAKSIMRIIDPTDGEIIFNGHDIAKLSKGKLRELRKDYSIIFQDPYGSLDPRLTAEKIVGEPLITLKLVKNEKEYRERINELFELVGLSTLLKDRLPHEFSGGQRQRLGIARALASNPSLIVCDEAISALDVSIQAQIINLLEDLQEKLGLTYLFIAHDLSAVRHISDRVAVMYLGRIVEVGDWKTLYENPQHPYTRALLDSVPIPDPFIEEKREHKTIQGEVPSLMNKPKGCDFSNRCPLASQECLESNPPLAALRSNHSVACFKVHSTVTS